MDHNHSKVFNVIAPIYAKFYDYQVRYYDETIIKVEYEIDITQYKTVLDIGCGTGALSYVLYKNGLKVIGIDIAEKMVEKSKEKLKNTDVKIYKVDPNKNFPFPDKSFDIVISSYVVHGLKEDDRINLYKEASRLAKEKVIFHDYNKNRALLTTIIEWLEQGDYFNFIKVAESEMKKHFKNVRVVNVYKRAAWYILEP
ncbi:MAG: ubiquinone/menaquinone biosynthesis C-methylase UbiE [Clostridium sp.]|jgi:ubiquinone/menaquinone biosynthesis C-methylase UbiE